MNAESRFGGRYKVAVGIMAKSPVPGEVKTRLMPLLGADGAAALHCRLTLQTLNTALGFTPDDTHLFIAGDQAHAFWQSCGKIPPERRHPQCEGHLGLRMQAAVDQLLRDADAALLVGTDCPVLTSAHLALAGDALKAQPMVFIPAEDGGYVLVGGRPPIAAVFGNLPWGSSTVMAETRKAMIEAGASLDRGWAELPTLWDIDRPEDYLRWSDLLVEF